MGLRQQAIQIHFLFHIKQEEHPPQRTACGWVDDHEAPRAEGSISQGLGITWDAAFPQRVSHEQAAAPPSPGCVFPGPQALQLPGQPCFFSLHLDFLFYPFLSRPQVETVCCCPPHMPVFWASPSSVLGLTIGIFLTMGIILLTDQWKQPINPLSYKTIWAGAQHMKLSSFYPKFF